MLSSAKHPLKALSLISEIAPSSATDVRLAQSRNALAPSEVSDEESVASLRLAQPEKAWAPTVRTLLGSSIEVSAAQPEKTPSPKEISVPGRLTLVNAPSSKMRGPISVMPSSMTTFLIRGAFSNQPELSLTLPVPLIASVRVRASKVHVASSPQVPDRGPSGREGASPSARSCTPLTVPVAFARSRPLLVSPERSSLSLELPAASPFPIAPLSWADARFSAAEPPCVISLANAGAGRQIPIARTIESTDAVSGRFAIAPPTLFHTCGIYDTAAR